MGVSGLVYSMIGLWLSLYFYFENTRSKKEKVVRVLGFILIILIPSHYQKNVSYISHAYGFVLGILGFRYSLF